MTPGTALKMLDMIEGTGQRVDLLTARVQALEAVVLMLVVSCAGLLVLCWFQLAALYCLARATLGPPPWEIDPTNPDPMTNWIWTDEPTRPPPRESAGRARDPIPQEGNDVLTRLPNAAELAAARLANEADRVRQTVGNWTPPKATTGAKPDESADDAPSIGNGGADPKPLRPCSVLVVAATADEADQLVRELRDRATTYTAAGTGGSLVGRAFDIIVYRPGWRGEKTQTHNPHPAADQWRTAVVRTRATRPGVELYL